MADVKWIKLTTDMFDNRKIKHLRRLPDGNNIVLIWVMLLTMAGRCNSGGMIFLTENIPYTPKMLADELDFEETTVQLALNALEQFNMIVSDGRYFSIAGWEEYQNIEGMEKIREQNRIRKQRQRENQKLLEGVSRDVTGQVTQSHATDIEEDKEKDNRFRDNILSDSDESKPQKRKRFVPPTIEEVQAYCDERQNGVNAEKFIDYYTSNGWQVGKNKMKDWKAAVRTWEKNGYDKQSSADQKKPWKPTLGHSFDANDFFEAAVAKSWKEKEQPKTAAEDEEIREKMEALKTKLGQT